MSDGAIFAHRIIEDDLPLLNLAEVNTSNPARPIAVPHACQACGEPACYGRGPIWACSPCWQLAGPWRTRCDSSP